MPDALGCPFCGHALTHYGEGQSEFPWQCDACNAAVSVDETAGVARTRRWDRAAARGVHDAFPLSALEVRP